MLSIVTKVLHQRVLLCPVMAQQAMPIFLPHIDLPTRSLVQAEYRSNIHFSMSTQPFECLTERIIISTIVAPDGADPIPSVRPNIAKPSSLRQSIHFVSI